MKKNKEDIGSNEIVSIEEQKLPREIQREELKRLIIKYIKEIDKGISQSILNLTLVVPSCNHEIPKYEFFILVYLVHHRPYHLNQTQAPQCY